MMYTINNTTGILYDGFLLWALLITLEVSDGNVDFIYAVAGSITLTSSNYDAYESEEVVYVCAVIRVEALEREIIIHLSPHDCTARSMWKWPYPSVNESEMRQHVLINGSIMIAE